MGPDEWDQHADMQINESIWDERSSLERLVRMLPGFRGYHVAENRREADLLFRSFGRARLDRVRAELEKRSKQKPRKARSPYRGLSRRLQRLCENLASESHPRFKTPLISIAASCLDPVYIQDEEIVRSIVSLSVAIHEHRTEPQDLRRELDRLERALAHRRALIDQLLD